MNELKKELEEAILFYGENHDFVARIYNKIANFHMGKDDFNNALDYYKKAETIYIALHTADSEMVIDVHYRIGKVMEAKAVVNNEDSIDVKKHFKKTLLMRQYFDANNRSESEITAMTSAHIDSVDSTMIYNDMAEDARLSGKLDEALPLYVKSIDLRRKKFGLTSSAVCPVLINYAELLKQLTRFDDAKLVLEEALAISIKSYGKKHPAVAECINNLGQVFRLLNMVDKAESLLLEALQLRRELFGDIDELVAATLNNLAELYREKGDYLQAINYHKIAIEAFNKAVGPDHPGSINAKGNLGITYRRFSRVNMDEGEVLLRDAVHYMQERDYNPKHPWLLKFGNEHILAQAQRLAEQGKHEQSLELFDTVLHKKRAMDELSSGVDQSTSRPMSPVALGQDLQLIAEGKIVGMIGKTKNLIRKAKHLEAEKMLQEIGSKLSPENKAVVIEVMLLRAENQFLIANFNIVAPLFTEALNSRIDMFGPDSVSLVEVMVGLAEYFRSQGEYEQADTFYSQAMKLITFATKNSMQTIGSQDVEQIKLYIITALGSSDLQRNMGCYAAAEQILEPLPSMCTANSFEDEPVFADCFMSLAALEFVKGEFSKAMDLYREAMDIRTKNYGRTHPKTASTMSHMGNVEFMLCNYESAGRYLDEALNIQLQFFPKNHPAIATSYFRKARLASAQDKFAEASQYMGVCYSARKERLGENHPSVAASLSGMADILSGNFLLKEALDQQSKAITSLRSFYSTTPFHATVIQSSVSLAKTLQSMSRFEDAISIFEQCLEMQKAQMDSLNVTQHLTYIDISLLYVDALLAVGKVSEAAAIVGKCGVSVFSLFKAERHFKTADCLYHLANVSKAQGRFKDAKYQYSLALTIKNQHMLQYNHRDICRIIAGAADNMREVGYFHDAFEACSTLESFISSMSCEESVREVHQTLASILHAKILVDRGKAILAETMFDAATKVVVKIFGEKSIQFLEIKIGLSRCYQQLNKINQAEKGMEEAVLIAKELLGMASPLTFETISTMHFLKSYLNTKPTDQSKACDALTEEVLPFFAEHSGIAHPLTVHTRGRIGIFMNKAKKDSGRKMIFDALKIFDRYKQLPFTYDHPWIQEMGGFEKRANVKERLSHTIEEFALASWAMPSYEGDRSFGVVPKNIWIDLKNFAEEAWGSVQYYGGDKPADVAIAGAANDATQPTPFARLRLSKTQTRKLLPASTPAAQMVSSSVAPSKVAKTSVVFDAPVAEVEVVSSGNEEALLSEMQIRKEVEDQLRLEQDHRKDVEDILAIERERLAVTSEMLSKEMNARFLLEQNMMMQNEDLLSTKLVVSDLKHLLDPLPLLEEDFLAKEVGDIDNSSIDAEIKADIDLTDEEIIQMINDPKIRAQIYASAFLFDRAMDLHQRGWYRQAQPLLEECFLVRDTHIHRVAVTSETLFLIAKNLSLSFDWELAQERFKKYLMLKDSNAHTGGAIKYVEAIMAQGINFSRRGMVSDAMEKYSDASKLLLSMPDGASHPCLGEILSNQAMGTLYAGKFMEARAMAERSQAIFAKVYGNSHFACSAAVFTKAEVLRESGSFKMSNVLIEQTLVSRRRYLGDSHPLVADCLLSFGICLMYSSRHQEAQTKIKLALAMRQKFFAPVTPPGKREVEKADLRVAEVIYWQGVLHGMTGNLKECIELLEKALNLQLLAIDMTEADLDKIFPSVMKTLYGHRSVTSTKKPVLLPASVKVDKPVMMISDSYLSTGKTYLEIGRFDLADTYLNRALNIRVGLNPGEDLNHYKIIECQLALAQLNRQRGEYKVELSLVQLLSNDGLRNTLGRENPLYFACQLELAEWYRDTGEVSQALSIAEVVVAWRLETWGDEHTDYGEALLVLADCLRRLGKFRRAKEALKQAFSVFKMIFGDLADGHLWLAKCQLCEADIKLNEFESPDVEELAPPAEGDAAGDGNGAKQKEEEDDQDQDEDDGSEKVTTDPEPSTPAEGDAVEGSGEGEGGNGNRAEEGGGENIEPVKVLPQFNNELYLGMTEAFKAAVTMLQKIFLPVGSLLFKAETSFLTVEDPSGGFKSFLTLSAHPLLQYSRANLGTISLHEHSKRQEFLDALSPEVQQEIKAEELMRKRKNREMTNSPGGLEELQAAIQDMLNLPLNGAHHWLQRFLNIERGFTFVLDPMEVAANDYLSAENFRRDGNYFAADEKYDNAFLTQLGHMGPNAAAKSVLVADTLLGKADNCRLLGNISLARTLYAQSSWIYRKCQGVDSEGVVKCSFGIGNLLYTLGLYDEANAVFLQVETQWIRFYTENSKEYSQVRTALALTNWKLGNFEKALTLATASLDVVKRIYHHDMNEFEREWKKLHDEQEALKIHSQDASGVKLMQSGQRVESDLVNTYLCLAYVALSMGTFDKFEEYLAGAKRTLEKFQRSLRLIQISQGGDAQQVEGLGDEDHHLMADILQCQVEKMLVMGQAREASKMIMKVMKFRIREFSRTANTEFTSFQATERRNQFFDSYDALSLMTIAKASLEMKKTSPGKSSDDKDMEAEVVNVDEDFGTAENDSEENTLPSAVKYNPVIVPPVFVYKSIPVIPHPATIDCLMLRGRICMELYDFADAKEMFDASARMMAKLLPHRQSLRKLSINFELANLTFMRGSYDEAKSMNEIVLQQRLQLCDEFHPDKAASLFALGRIGLTMCRFDDAGQTFAETIKIRKKTFGDQHWLVGDVYMGYAEVLSGKGLYADSNGYFEKALKLFRASFGEMHPLIARANVSHGSNMRDLGSLDFALSLIEQAIAVQCIMFGDDHPSVALSLYNKASILRSQGKALETKRVLDLIIATQREKLGKYHPVTVSTLLLIAFNFMDLAKYSTAGQVFERANQLLRKTFGKDHAIVAIGMTGLAECFRYKAMYKKAKDGHETALYMRRKVLGEKHPAVAESLYFLGELQLIAATLDDATRSFDDALALQRMALGNAHPDIALSMQGLGKTQLAQGKLLEAKGTQERVLAMRKSILPAEHPTIGDSQFLIAQIYRKLGKLDQASALFERCASTVRDTRGARHPLVATVVYHAAEVANVLGKFDQARDGFMESLRIRMHVYNDVNEDHPETAESYFGLAENFKSTGMYDFAKPNAGVVGFGKQMQSKEANLFSRTVDDGSVSVGDPNLTAGRSIADSILDGEDVLEPQKESPRQTIAEKQNDNDMKDEASQLTLYLDEAKTQDDNSFSNLRTGQATSNNVEIIAQYRAALPLLEKVLAMLQTVEIFEPTHPAILQVRFSMAETFRYLGRFEESAPIFEEVLMQRRKQLGDGHPDTVQAMFGMADALRCMGKLFADNPSGSVEAREIKKAMSSVLSGVTLRDHLTSITTSPPSIPGRPETSTSGKRAGTAASGSRKWAFLTQPTDGENKKKTALKISKGYMGYEFPKDKQLTRSDLPRAAAAVTEKGKGKKVNMGDAKQLYEAGLAAMRALFGGQLVEHPVVAGLLFAEGELMRARRSHKEALQLLEQALAMRRRLFRGSHPAIADCLNAMAEVFRVENKFSQAAPMFEKALEIRMEAYSGSHPCIAEIKNNIAMLHFSQGNYIEAQRLMEDALFTCEELLGPLHPATAVTLNNLAGLLHSLSLYDKALPIYKRALKIKEKAFGADHPDVASTLNNIGLLYKMQGQLDDAQAQYESALEMQKKLYGSVHADVAATMSNLASLYAAQGKFYDAKELYKQAIAMRTTIYGLDHQAVASTYNNYGGLMVLTKEFDTARDLFESALKIKIKVYGEAHPSVAETMNNIAFVLYSQGHLRESLPIFEKALSIKAHAYGMENPTVATAYFTVAGIYHKTGDFDKARERYLEAKEMRFGLFGGRHKDTKLCDDMLDALEKDRLKAVARDGRLKNSLRTQTITSPLLLSEGSIYEDDKAVPQFESNRN